ncbi:MAG: peroxiredoxin family protein [Acidimicrobiia bacterium]|nr:peroxiredoxin family protein [Acidimicrobiia bacterium]
MALENGATLPEIAGIDAEGGEINVTDLVEGSWGAVLFYRGHW